MDWFLTLRLMLCKLYEEWGGQCPALGETPKDWIDTVIGEYDTAGPPSLPTQADVDRCLGELDDLDACLADPANKLDGTDTERLAAFSASLRKDITE